MILYRYTQFVVYSMCTIYSTHYDTQGSQEPAAFTLRTSQATQAAQAAHATQATQATQAGCSV